MRVTEVDVVTKCKCGNHSYGASQYQPIENSEVEFLCEECFCRKSVIPRIISAIMHPGSNEACESLGVNLFASILTKELSLAYEQKLQRLENDKKRSDSYHESAIEELQKKVSDLKKKLAKLEKSKEEIEKLKYKNECAEIRNKWLEKNFVRLREPFKRTRFVKAVKLASLERAIVNLSKLYPNCQIIFDTVQFEIREKMKETMEACLGEYYEDNMLALSSKVMCGAIDIFEDMTKTLDAKSPQFLGQFTSAIRLYVESNFEERILKTESEE